ncbi:MAG: sigma-54-dependent Fis family transcriptional regulator [Nitrospinota bacterium]|nr:MAG: sigma-54-dependent Fis family transcriptional regulator [Nitrospinota bacterium]
MPRVHVLIVDDDEIVRSTIGETLAGRGYQISAVACGDEACQVITRHDIDVVLLDVVMPGMGGLEVLGWIKEHAPFTEVIMLTGYGTIDSAVQAMQLGASHYLTKPCQLDALDAVIQKAYETRQKRLLQSELTYRERFPELIGQSLPLKAIKGMIEKVAPTDSTVLVQGESGVGKELIARCIHRHSPRSSYPFVVVDCTVLQENLLQSELFGHERGSFTGAIRRKPGLFEVAHRGTLFLDEIGEMTLSTQAQLLRVLETGRFRRLGGTRDILTDVRIIGATKQDLQERMAAGQFREDLYYRLNVITITPPPLRERPEDIPLLVEYFLHHMPIPKKRKKRITPEAMSILQSYSWPGNIRELRNILERAVILSEGDEITARDLPADLRGEPNFWVKNGIPILSLPQLKERYLEVEKQHIATLLARYGGHRSTVARLLQISERNLYRKIKQYQLD